MDFEADRDPGPTGDPSLADMTRSALNILQKNSKGFFLFVEGMCHVVLYHSFKTFIQNMHYNLFV